ncbi:MAG: hypothetical protein ACYSR0_12365 [Planctomycetota bacterium]|jgi:hypothetical protein
MTKIQLTPKQVLEYIILGIRNENYQAAIDIAQDCIDEMELMAKAEVIGPKQVNKTEEKLIAYLEWSLDMFDENFKETGTAGMAKVIVYKSAKRFLREIKK